MDSREKALQCARYADEKNARDITILELKGVSALADYFLLCSATSDRHAHAVADYIQLSLKQEGITALGVEGAREAKWVLLDFDDVIVHVFQQDERAFYDLDTLWIDCPRLAFQRAAAG